MEAEARRAEGGGGDEGAPPRAPRADGGGGRGRGEGRGRGGGRGEGRGGGRGGGGEGGGGGAKTSSSAPKTESSADEDGGAAADASPPVEGSQLFVGNLSWETGWRDLKDHFLTIGAEVERADVAVGRDGRKKGFGFVRYGNAEDAAKAIEELNGVEFMGRPLEVRLDNKA